MCVFQSETFGDYDNMKVIYDCSVPLHPIMEDKNGVTGHCAGVGPFSDN